MATITSTATGNFTAGATWVGGVAPGVGDVAVAAMGHVVTIDADVTVDEFRQAGTGYFLLGNGRTITGDVYGVAGTTNGTVLFTATTGFIVGSVISSTTTNTTKGVVMSGAGTLTVTGDITSGSATARIGVQVGDGCALVVVGDVTSTSTSAAITALGSGSVTVTGTVTQTSNSTTSQGAINGATGTITVVGQVGDLAIRGPGVALGSSAGFVDVTGTIQSGTGNAVTGTGGTLVFSGFLRSGPNGEAPYTLPKALLRYALGNEFHYVTDVTGTAKLVSTDRTDGMPAASDVRESLAYGLDGLITGALVVPPANTVALGVPVDGTTGTAALTPAAFWDYALASADTEGSIGEHVAALSGGGGGGLTEEQTEAAVVAGLTTYTAATAADVGTPLQSDDARLDNLDAAVSSRLADEDFVPLSNDDVIAIRAVTDLLPDGGALTSLAQESTLDAVAGDVGAVKAQTDGLTYTVEGVLDANVQAVNDVPLDGAGTADNRWRPAD